MIQHAHLKGFVKRAAEYGLNEHQAFNIYKQANGLPTGMINSPLQPAGTMGANTQTSPQSLPGGREGIVFARPPGSPASVSEAFGGPPPPAAPMTHPFAAASGLANRITGQHQQNANIFDPMHEMSLSHDPNMQQAVAAPSVPAPAPARPPVSPQLAGGQPFRPSAQDLARFRKTTNSKFNANSAGDMESMRRLMASPNMGLRGSSQLTLNSAQARAGRGNLAAAAGGSARPGTQLPGAQGRLAGV